MRSLYKKLGLLALVALLTACGGGGGGGGDNNTATAGGGSGNSPPPAGSNQPPPPGDPMTGIDRLGVVAGVITNFGSIFVNGQRISTASAQFDVDDDGVGSSEDDLNVGDFVVVVVDADEPGVALIVVSDEAVEGRVDSVDVSGDSMVVSGQTVMVTATTVFDDSDYNSLADVSVGDFVEVAGFFEADGSIRATRIEREDDTDVEVHGVITNLTDSTFTINGLTIDYVSVPAELDDDLPGGTLREGLQVEVEGQTFSGDVLLATEVEPDGIGVGDDGDDLLDDFADVDEVDLEGVITRFVSPSDFDVSGLPVTTTSATEFEGGTVSDLALNVLVEIDGTLNDNGVIVAEEVEFEDEGPLSVTAAVDAVDPAAGTITLLGIEVQIDDSTLLDDQSDAELIRFSIDDINVGDAVTVVGSDVDNDGVIEADVLERDDPDSLGNEAEIEGFVDSVAAPFITVLGVKIDVSGADFADAADAAAFFALIEPGDLVDVDGIESSDSLLVAEEVEIDSD